MLKEKIVQDVLACALSEGGDFSEIFVENTRRSSIVMVNGKVDNVASGLDYGLGLRIFKGNNAIYVYTNDTNDDTLMKLAKDAAIMAKSGGHGAVQSFSPTHYAPSFRTNPFDVPKKDKVVLLQEADCAARAYSPLITQTRGSTNEIVQDTLIANSEGLWVTDNRTRSRFAVEVVASDGSEKQTGHQNPGATKGYEFFESIDVKALSQNAAEVAVTMLKADLCPSGMMPVVIDNGFGGVIFHEACGHALEATSVAKGASVFCDMLNKPIASSLVTAVDDATIAGEWGSIQCDDEGTPSRRTVLIENGILKSYLIDRLNGLKMGMPSTGSARRQSYRYAPTSRMTNTFIASGAHTPQQIIAATDYGLYAKKMGGGSVEPVTGEYNFAVLEGYLIRNGKIAEPVRGATLIGKGNETLMDIDMVGNNIQQAQGMCGSVSGSIPVNVGQPMIRVSKLTVGGRK